MSKAQYPKRGSAAGEKGERYTCHLFMEGDNYRYEIASNADGLIVEIETGCIKEHNGAHSGYEHAHDAMMTAFDRFEHPDWEAA